MTDQPTMPEVVNTEPETIAVLRETVPMNALPEFFARAYQTVERVVREEGLQPVGPAYAVYYGTPGDTVDVAAGFPAAATFVPRDGVHQVTIPGGRAVRLLHLGSYDGLAAAYDRLMVWIRGAEVGELADYMLEKYLTLPGTDPDATATLIVWPIQE
ncbi:MAG TPA: GyrI-like domain-containing protein [Actinomycetaceae bacterium]|nr:GyrI-like domain-containing protein [Actinomycetaceae bacterium]